MLIDFMLVKKKRVALFKTVIGYVVVYFTFLFGVFVSTYVIMSLNSVFTHSEFIRGCEIGEILHSSEINLFTLFYQDGKRWRLTDPKAN